MDTPADRGATRFRRTTTAGRPAPPGRGGAGVAAGGDDRAAPGAAAPAGQGPAASWRTGAAAWSRLALALAVAALVTGVLGGLLRAGVVLLPQAAAPVVAQAAVWHAALMIGAFFGTVIGVERAVALRRVEAFVAPLAAAAGGAAILLGQPALAAPCFVLAGVAFVAVNVAVVRRQAAPHTLVLLVAAAAWLAGSLLHWVQPGHAAVHAWWFTFLVLTIAAERLEMTRLLRRRHGAEGLLYAVLGLVLGGATVAIALPQAGAVIYGIGLAALAGWLMVFDIARRTVRTRGLSRYMAVCLLGGYAWLAAGGIAWAATGLGVAAARDAALHAIGLGFVFAMVFGHAPVIVPAVARWKVAYGAWFYVPLAALHASLLVRLCGPVHDAALKPLGAALNGVAILLFMLTLAGSVAAWRLRHPGTQT